VGARVASLPINRTNVPVTAGHRDEIEAVPERDIPDNVKRLLSDHITSVEQLEVLLLLFRHPWEPWTSDRVTEELRTSPSSAHQRLSDLVARGLLRIEQNPERFIAEPRWASDVAGLARAYSERRYTVINLIFSKPIDNLKVYADAFRFKKEEPDG